MKRRKILMVLNRLEIGGAETHVVDLSSALQQMGWDVLVASGGGVYEETLRELGIRHYYVPADVRSMVRMREAGRALERIIRTEEPDVVHAHARIPAFLCGRLQKKMGFPLVTTAHWTFEVNSLLRAVSNWGQQTIAVSEDIREYLISNYPISAGRIHVIPNGINTRRFRGDNGGEAVRAELGIPADAETVTCVTRLHTSRAESAWLLTKIAPELASSRPGIRILIVGDGECLPALREKADRINRELGYPCLLLPGGRTDIPEILSATDVFVGVSRAALEAMSCRRPVILCGNEGYGGIVRAENAARYMATNYCCRDYPGAAEEDLRRDVLRLLNMEPGQRAALGEDGRRIVLEDFSEQAMARETAGVYELAMHPRRSVVVSGYYGYRNLGDDAILEMICRDFAADSDITVLSRRPRETARYYGVNTVHRFRMLRVLRAIRNADLLLSGGGSILQDKTSTRSLLYYLIVLKSALRSGVSTAVYANGIGPIRSKRNRRRTGNVLKNVDWISLRDQDSADMVREMDLGITPRVSADPVFRMEPASEQAAAERLREAGIPEGAALFAVCLRKGNRGDLPRIAALLDRTARESSCTPVFFNMQEPDDLEAARAVQALMETPSFLMSGRISGPEMIALLRETRGIVSMRLHALIFGAAAGIPLMGFDEDPKLVSLLRTLGAPEAIPMGRFDPAQTAEQIARILAEGAAPDIARQRELAGEDPDQIRALLKRDSGRRVVHIIGGGDTGGAKTHILALLRGLIRQGCRVRLVCFLEGDFAREAREAGIPTMVLPRNDIPGNLRWLVRYIRKNRVEVVHCHGAKANMYGAMLLSRVDAPVVTTVHSDPELDYMGRPAADRTFGAINRRALHKIEHFICVSDAMRELMESRGIPRQRLDVIYNGVDVNGPEPAMDREAFLGAYGIPADRDAVLFGIAARFNPVKDIPTLLRAFGVVAATYPQARLLLAGDGEDRKRLEEMARECAPAGTVFFLGWVRDTDSFYNAIDVNVLTSLSETFPYALTEGGKMRCATIATRVGGIPHMVADGETGLLFEPGDADQLARYMEQMIADPDRRRRLGTAMYQRTADRFSLESMVRTQLGIYDRLLGGADRMDPA